MPFTPIVPKQKSGDFKKNEFITLAQGANLIRILDPDYLAVETHFINRMSIKCLGDDCPVCANNKIIINENPDTFRDIKGYYPRSTRYFINVYDKTNAKICPACGEEVKNANALTCTNTKCNAPLKDVPFAPINKVKILSKGVTLFEQLGQLELAILDAEGTPLGLTNFDLILMIAGTGKDTTTTPIYTGHPGENPDVKPEDKFDLKTAVITLNETEIRDFQMGTSLKDIYTARRLSNDTVATPNTDIPESLQEAADRALALFK